MKHPTSFLNGMLKVNLHTTKLTDKLVKKKNSPKTTSQKIVVLN